MLDALLAGAPTGSVALLFIDLDNFKTVNDSLGHGVGDQLLTRDVPAARATRSGVTTLLARFGGDEFIVVMLGARRAGDVRPGGVAERLRGRSARPVDVEGTELFVTGEHRVLHEPSRPGDRGDDLLRDADAAMYRAKARGRDCVEAFAPVPHESTGARAAHRRPSCAGASSGARSCPYFQPIVELRRVTSSGSRCWPAGCTPTGACWRRRSSCRSPRRPG